jgi:hypothetical protein
MKYTNFQGGSQIKWLKLYYHENKQLGKDMFRQPCGFAYQIQPMCKYCKMLIA